MRFGSVCSGIEAASVAWHPLGWQAAWLSEIEPFPSDGRRYKALGNSWAVPVVRWIGSRIQGEINALA